MKTITAVALALQSLVATAFSPIDFPEDRLEVTRKSGRILVVEVTRVTPETTRTLGIEITSYKIDGKVVEVIRGERPDKWTHTAIDIKVIDMKSFKEALGDAAEMALSEREFKKEGSTCKVGERYLVIYWRGNSFFVRVSDTDQSWRNKIKQKDAAEPQNGA